MAPCVKIVVSFDTGEVAVLSFVTRGESPTLPRGAKWENPETTGGHWTREPTDPNVFHEIEKTFHGRKATGYRRITDDELPDRAYREAWRDEGGKLTHYMPKARELHLARVRHVRARRLAELDGDWMRESGPNGRKPEADAIEAKRQTLRDLPVTLNVDEAQTIDELKAKWSPLLGPYGAAR